MFSVLPLHSLFLSQDYGERAVKDKGAYDVIQCTKMFLTAHGWMSLV
jgi:hypothetical protein